MPDLIERGALLKAIDAERKSLVDNGMLGAEHVLVLYGRRLIEEAELVEAKLVEIRQQSHAVHAHWIVGTVREGSSSYRRPICSNCKGETVQTKYYSDYMPSYCPDCGAMMDEEVEDRYEHSPDGRVW